jgi:formyl-CoA transferase
MQSMAERLFQTIGREELIRDPRYLNNTERLRHDEELDAIIAEFIRNRTQAENLALFDKAGVTVGPVCDASDLALDGYVSERETLVSVPDDDMGQLPMHNVTPRLSGTPGAIRTPAPTLGQHTEEILSELNVSPQQRRKLRQAGVV